MKPINLIIHIVLLIICLPIYSQDNNQGKNSSNDKITQMFNPFKESIYSQYDIFSFDVYWSAWNQPVNEVKTGKFSFGFNFNYFFDIPFSAKSPVALAIGAGYGHFNLHHTGNLVPSYDSLTNNNYTTLEAYSGQDSRKKNKILSQYIYVPLELRFRIPLNKSTEQKLDKNGNIKKHHFKIYLGFKAGYQVNFKQVTVDNDGTKSNFKNYPDRMRWRYGCTVRVGWNDIFLFGSYYFSPLFKNHQSTQIYPFTFGISIGG